MFISRISAFKSIIAFATLEGTCFAYLLYRYLKERKICAADRALFFWPLDNEDDHFNNLNYQESETLKELLSIIERAERSIKICMYNITNFALAQAIIKCHASGIVVKIISDAMNTGEVTEVRGSQFGALRKEGIDIRLNRSRNWMHHKFVIIDDKILLTGSFNFTKQGVNNFENILITYNPRNLKSYQQAFSRMWKMFNQMKQQTK